MKKLNSSQITEIIKLYNAGTAPLAIAKLFGIYNNSVTRLLRKQGVIRNQLVKVADETIAQIIEEYASGASSEAIAYQFDLDGSTICRILKKNNISMRRNMQATQLQSQDVQAKIDHKAEKKYSLNNESDNEDDESDLGLKYAKQIDINNYGNFYVVQHNGIGLTSDYLKTISEDEKRIVADDVLPFYRQHGFPYLQLNDNDLIREFNKLRNFDASKVENNKILSISNPSGTNIIKHFSPHFFEMKSGLAKDKPSMVEVFHNDVLFKKVLINRLFQNYGLSGNMLRQGLVNSHVAYKASTFNTLIAKFIYSKYTKENDTILDYSMGFGHRLLASLSLGHKVKYVGVDPFTKSANSNQAIFDYYKEKLLIDKEADILNIGSENFDTMPYEGKVAVAFSSPPYFNQEIYENSSTQAYFGENYSNFINVWWKKTVENIDKALMPDGYFILNMREVLSGFNLAKDMLNIASSFGYKVVDTYQIQLSKNLMFKSKKSSHKFEPIFAMQKIN